MAEYQLKSGAMQLEGGKAAISSDCCFCQSFSNSCEICFAVDETPQFLEVVISGVLDCVGGLPCNCADLNGTFIFELFSGCFWRYPWDGFRRIFLELHDGAQGTRVQGSCVDSQSPTCFLATTEPDCDNNLSNEKVCGTGGEGGTLSWSVI